MTKRVRKAAVLGAGVMGAQIAGHLANAGVEVVLFELPAKEGDKSAMAKKAIASLKKLKPAPYAAKGIEAAIMPANYDENLSELSDCDLVIEAIAERMDWKKDLYEKIADHVGDDTVLASNTSGLGINTLAEALPEKLRERFLGVHFFNPPRYMHLVELIPAAQTRADILQWLEAFFVSVLGKGVVFAKDTPNFIGNRVGVFSMISTMYHAERLNIGFEVVDQLTGKPLGRPKSGTYRTADVVGLDTMGHVINTMKDYLPDDPWHKYYEVPSYIAQLVENGALGQKTRQGIYAAKGKQVFSLEAGDYVDATGTIDEDVQQLLAEKDPAKRIAGLRASDNPQAQFVWSILRDLFHYCCYWLSDIAETARDVDFAIRWGYGWKQGPFEIMQASGWSAMAQAIKEDIANGDTMSDAELPAWVEQIDAVHNDQGSYSATSGNFQPLSDHPVYQRQAVREDVIGASKAGEPLGETVFETDDVRLWHEGDGIAVLSLKTKMHTVGDGVLEGVQRACAEAEENFDALVVWSPDQPFSAGANLMQVATQVKGGDMAGVEKMIENFQEASMALKHSLVPTVAAVNGLALGGGCEFQMHCNRTVAALEAYAGLVEAGVGLVPAGGGLKELVVRAQQQARGGDVQPHIQNAFNLVAMGKVSSSGLEAKQMGLFEDSDVVICNAHELLHVAKQQARAMAESGFRPPLRSEPIKVLGKTGKATLMMMAVNMLEGHFISEHDYEIAGRIADTLCGGEVEAGSMVSQDWLLKLERDHFIALLGYEKTLERIEFMLKKGKPLRN
ncbi:3-hydroxyacyl-CoA dehydrogenase [gamma proteobacterium HTCC5015]|nr:3-hydroxyacyl-CoA dehydrogenase [gamma proteobacterium HTCC5015]